MMRSTRFALLGVALFAVAALSQAAVIKYAADLAPEAVGATGSGSVEVTYDSTAHTLLIDAVWSGLSGTTTAAHIHCCTAVAGTGTIGVAVTPSTLPGFPAGVTSGTYGITLDLAAPATFQSAFLTASGGSAAGAEAALIAGFDAGKAYFNIHSNTFPGGEIRGFLAQVPEPGTLALLGLGLAGLATSRRHRR